MESKLYKCSYCGAVLCLPKRMWQLQVICPTCEKEMIKLSDDFELSEIITTEETKENE